MKRLFISILIVIPFSLSVLADSLVLHESIVSELFNKINSSSNDSVRYSLAVDLQKEMVAAVSAIDDIDYDFLSLDNVGKIISSDKKLCLYTWNILFTDGSSSYYAIIRHVDCDSVFRLSAVKPEEPSLYGSYNVNNWYGALYYDAYPLRYRDGSTSYLLLGMIFPANVPYRCKVAEILTILDGKLILGHRNSFLFPNNSKSQSRLYFEYEINSIMSLEYDERKKCIFFDHLSPISTMNNGKFLYGPDMSVDSFEFRKDVWNYEPDVNVKNKVR